MSETWRQYICRACGVIYDEALGDPDSGLAPGTRFEEIPDDWACPICGVTKADFELYERRVAITPPAAAPVVAARKPGVVIVGGGAAAWAVAMALRGLDAETPITLVTACAGDIYHKPELSIALSRGASVDSLRREDGAQAAARIGVRLLAHTHAIAIEAARNRLRTTRGSIGYSHLVLAHGARPALPSQLPPELCWRVNDLRAWGGLRAKIGDAPRRIAIVGAGMVGCELAEDFARAGHAVTLLDVQPLPLAGLLPDAAGRRLARGLAACGVRFVGGVAVKTLRRLETGALRLTLNNAVTIEADIATAATGLTVDPRLARTAGLAFERGVVVDPKTLQTSAANIFALGDCVSIHGRPCRFIEPIAGQAAAIAHAVAGRSHAGYAHQQPVIRLKTRSTPIVIHGAPDPDAPWRVLRDDAGGLVMEQWRDGALQSRLAA